MLTLDTLDLKRTLLSFLGGLITYLIICYFKKTGVEIHFSNEKFKSFVNQAASLKTKRFFPFPFVSFPIGQSWLSHKFPCEKVEVLVHTRESFQFSTGGTGNVEWITEKNKDSNKYNPNYIAFILPGLQSKPTAYYLQDLYCKLLRANFRTVLFMPRFNEPKFELPRNRHLDLIQDIRDGIQFVKSKYPNAKLIGVGHSYGGNSLVNYLSKYKEEKDFIAAVTVANPFNFEKGAVKIKGTIVDNFLTVGLKKIVQAAIDDVVREAEYHKWNVQDIMNGKNTYEIDDIFTSKLLGYKNANDYYKNIGCGNRVFDVKIPLLFMNSYDDSFIDHTGLPITGHKQNDNLICIMSRGGGHIGWVQGLFKFRRWHTQVITDFVKWTADTA